MSDSEDSTVTYTGLSSPFGGLSDIRSLRVEGPPMMPEYPYAYVVAAFHTPPSPDYVPGPEHPPLPEFVSEPVYLKFIPPEDEVLPAEEQLLPATVLPTAKSPGYITDFDTKEDPEEDLLIILSTKETMMMMSHPTMTRMMIMVMVRRTRTRMRRRRRTLLRDSIPPPPVHRTPSLLPIPLPTPSPPLTLPSTSYKVDVPVVTLPPQNRLCIALGPRYEVGESSSAAAARPTRGSRADYGFVATLDDEIRRDPKRDMMDFAPTVRQDADEIYGRLDDAQDDRALICGRVNMLYRDRYDHARTARLMETEARLSRQDWVQSMDTSDLACYEVMALHTQTQMAKFQRQQGPAKGPAHPDASEEFERMETVFRISNCIVENQIKFATCTLLGSALTWWNSHVTTVGPDVAYAMTWTNMRKKMTDKYCPRGEFKKLEGELWNLRVKSNDMVGYNQCFQELALLCVRMFPEESDKVERYVGRLPDVIYGSVVASRPKTMQEAIEMATELMDKRNNTFAERQAKNKRKFDDASKNNQIQQQQQNKRQNTAKAYTVGSGDKKPYGGYKPLCPKYNYHHDGQCASKFHKCNRVGHLARDCRSGGSTNTANNQRGIGTV
nr:reverse transcriptase domain-containing protein [Tanacetum cinerariifolium]